MHNPLFHGPSPWEYFVIVAFGLAFGCFAIYPLYKKLGIPAEAFLLVTGTFGTLHILIHNGPTFDGFLRVGIWGVSCTSTYVAIALRGKIDRRYDRIAKAKRRSEQLIATLEEHGIAVPLEVP